MKYKLVVLIGIIFFLSLASFLWWQQAVKPPNPKDETPTIFTVNKGESVRSIADRLENKGLIRSPVAFFLLARFGSIGDKIQAGDFRLNQSMDLYTLADFLTHGTLDVWIIILEGWRNEEIALKLAQEVNIPESEFLKEARQGYMFPDTYLIPKDASISAIIRIFLDNFNAKMDENIKTRARQKGLSLDELIIIASLVEREAKLESDRPLVASVVLNRLKLGMKLDIDATIQYALGYQPAEKKWWKKNLTSQDLEIDSPYNTYKNAGLPPKPIANPGLASIKAVVETPETDYLYYVSEPSGKTHFASTLEEHQNNIKKYLNN